MQSLGDRMKGYENVSRNYLTPNTPVIIRIDGRAFHSFTRGMTSEGSSPFYGPLIHAMREATRETAKELMGFKLGYVQSDEASFVITDYDKHETQGWFGYNLSKIISISASTFTAHFNHIFQSNTDYKRLATFDARAFNIPEADVPNYFLWRARDWEKNSISMVARKFYSQKELNGIPSGRVLEMLREEKLHEWGGYSDTERRGTFVRHSDGKLILDSSQEIVYSNMSEMFQDAMDSFNQVG